MKVFFIVAALSLVAIASSSPMVDETSAMLRTAPEQTTAENFIAMVKAQCQMHYPPPSDSTWGQFKHRITKAWRKVAPLTGKSKALAMICGQVPYVLLDTYDRGSVNSLSFAESEYGGSESAHTGSVAGSDSGSVASVEEKSAYYDVSSAPSTQS